MTGPHFLTPAMAAERLGCTEEDIYECAAGGWLAGGYWIGRQLRFRATELAMILEEREPPDPDPWAVESREKQTPLIDLDIPRLVAKAGIDPSLSIIYAIEAGKGGPVKVGRVLGVERLRRRYVDLQIGCPLELRLVCVMQGGSDVEAWIHRDLAAYRMRGEWFDREAALRRIARHPEIYAQALERAG